MDGIFKRKEFWVGVIVGVILLIVAHLVATHVFKKKLLG